jgi:two-component system invasion response regulator UvrY
MHTITILIADDHKLVRDSLSYILKTDTRFEIIAECQNGEEAVEEARRLRPHVVMMDINLPGISGIEATRLIRKYSPITKILAVSLHTQPTYVRKIMQSGASGYVSKNSNRQEMSKAIEEILKGNKYICNSIKDILAEQMLDDKPSGVHSLTVREVQIISFLKEGHSSKEIATKLNLATKTVEVHRYNILKKLELKNVAELVDFINRSQVV